MDCVNQNLFPGQKPDEKIILFARRHFISFLPTTSLALLMIILPLTAIFVAIYVSKISFTSHIVHYFMLASSAYVLFVLTFFIVSWIDYYFDVLIVTNERLVNIEQNGLFSRHISELDLLRVQNVSTSIKGIIPTVFDYGSVVVQTAGENIGSASSASSDFAMEGMPHPNHISQEILRLHQELANTRGQSQALTNGEGEIHPYKQSNDSDSVKPEQSNQNTQNQPDNQDKQDQSDQSDKKNEIRKPAFVSDIANEGQLKEGEIVDL